MFKATAIILSLTAALQLVLASSITLTAPKANSHLEAGSSVEITWKVESTATGPIRIQYASGPSQSLTINGLIADNIDASLGKYTWTVPKDIKQKKIVIEAGPDAKDLSFLGYLNIKKGVTTKKPATKHTTTKKTTKKHTTTKKGTKKTTKHTSTKKGTKTTKKGTKTTKKGTKKATTKNTATGKKPKAVCIGYPSSGEGVTAHNSDVKCHSLPKGKAVSAAKKATHKKTKKHTKKHSATKKTIKHPKLVGA